MAKKAKLVVKTQPAAEESVEKVRIEMKRLKDMEVDNLKKKLLEVRTIGQKPIYVTVEPNDDVADALESAKIQAQDDDIKVEGLKEGQRLWVPITLGTRVFDFEKIAVTTKVAGSF